MQIINTLNLNQARKQIQEFKKQKKPIIIKAQNDEFNRKILENKDVDIVVGLESHNRKDRLKQRDSGLNEILCKIAKKNNIKIGMDLEKIKNIKGREKAVLLARIIQNIKLCKKTGAEIVLIGKYEKKNAFSFLVTLGASTEMAKKAVEETKQE